MHIMQWSTCLAINAVTICRYSFCFKRMAVSQASYPITTTTINSSSVTEMVSMVVFAGAIMVQIWVFFRSECLLDQRNLCSFTVYFNLIMFLF